MVGVRVLGGFQGVFKGNAPNHAVSTPYDQWLGAIYTLQALSSKSLAIAASSILSQQFMTFIGILWKSGLSKTTTHLLCYSSRELFSREKDPSRDLAFNPASRLLALVHC